MIISSSFKFFVGIDQTGARDSRGLPKALACSVIARENNKSILYTNLLLPSLTKAGLRSLGVNISLKDTFILVDSVLGIPYEGTTKKNIRTLFNEASNYSFDGKALGATTAYEFFISTLLKNSAKEIPTREAERKAGANSIFRLRPFQRNIGCGTFRIWKELGVDPEWFSVWPLENKKTNSSVIAEGYPSFVWKNWIKASRGNKDALIHFAKSKGFKINFGKSKTFLSVDQMDGCVLALYAAVEYKQLSLIDLPDIAIKKEGWIFGLT